MPYHVALDQARESARRATRSARPAAASARPTRTRSRAARVRVADLLDPDGCRDKLRARARLPQLRADAVPTRSRRGRLRDDARRDARARARASRRWSPTSRRCSASGAHAAANRCCSKARRVAARHRSRHLSVRDELELHRRRGAAPAPASARTLIDYVLGIVKAYATRVGGGPFPTETRPTTIGEALAQARQRVRRRSPDARAAAAGSTSPR